MCLSSHFSRSGLCSLLGPFRCHSERFEGLVPVSRVPPSFRRVGWISLACGCRLRLFPASIGFLSLPDTLFLPVFPFRAWLCLGRGSHWSPKAHSAQQKDHPLCGVSF